MIVVKEGVFVEEKTNRRVRFLATNLTARAAFPTHADADRIALRMARLGINLVRLHHLQNGWEKDGGTIWKPGKPFLEVDPKQVDALDYLVGALKKQGIYTNLNLTTTREYLPEHGFPESVAPDPVHSPQEGGQVQPTHDRSSEGATRGRSSTTSIPIQDSPTARNLLSPSSRSTTRTPWWVGPTSRRERASTACPSRSAASSRRSGTPGSPGATARTRRWAEAGPERRRRSERAFCLRTRASPSRTRLLARLRPPLWSKGRVVQRDRSA